MKNLVPIILGIIIGAAAMYFYCQNDEASLEGMIPAAPKGIVKPEEIKTLTAAYSPRYDSISSIFFRGVEGGDNRSSWYSLEDLNNYLDSAENQAGELKYTMDGVRLYLGAHPAVGNVPGYTTMLFVPTGYPIKSEGNMLNFKFQGGSPDIPGGDGLDRGGMGIPPGANYPQ